MKCLTIHQPYAWAILHAGKDVENRPRNTHVRGRFYVHAGQQYWELPDVWRELLTVPEPERAALQFGAIIGSVALVDVVRDSGSGWAAAGSGNFHWLLADPEPLAKPIPIRGRQGWWNYL